MKNSGTPLSKMPKSLFESLLVFTGISILIFSVSLDLFRPGTPGIGFQQLAGIVIGLLIIAIGLRYWLFADISRIDWLLLSIYLSGILVVGLKPRMVYEEFTTTFLSMHSIFPRDLFINVVGFIPLGFLMVASYLAYRSSTKRFSMLLGVTLAGMAISLFIETVQYLAVMGRFSSAMDLATNTLGTLLGGVAYFGFIRYRRMTAKQIKL